LWSIEGCSKKNAESDLLTTVCECDHLTNFAALMDTSGRENNIKSKSILTQSCCGLSIIGLYLTIVFNLRPKRNSNRNLIAKEREKLRIIVILNLCICLLMSNLLVILAMDKTDDKVLFISCIESIYLYRISIINWQLMCQFSSGLLLYLLLSSFFWMLLEGYRLYKSLVLCFDYEFKKLRLYLIGYGTPFLICVFGLALIWSEENILLEALYDERYNHL
jgi:hypothetical protein